MGAGTAVERPTGHNFEHGRRGGCRGCGGTGKVSIASSVEGEDPQLLNCIMCEGSGNRYHALLRRAYLAGWRDGIEAMRNALPMSPDGLHNRTYSNDHLLERLINEDYRDIF